MGVCAAAVVMPFVFGTPALAQDPITFDQILADPGNTELNIAYARQEAEAGNLLKALAALERVLIAEPNADDARFYYATLLDQIGDDVAAQNELNELESRPISSELREQIQRYREGNTRRGGRGTRIFGSLGLGFSYDDNVSGLTDEASDAALKEDDYGITGRAQLKLVRDINGNPDRRFVAQARVLAKAYEDFDVVNFTFATVSAGFEGDDGDYSWQALIRARNLTIGGDNYLTEVGPYLRLGKTLTQDTSLQFTGYYNNQEYENISIGERPTIFEDQRSGSRSEATLRLRHNFTQNLRGSIGAGYQNKTAEYEPYEYDGAVVYATLDKFFRNGAYFDFDFIYRDLQYAELDGRVLFVPQFPGQTREDDRYYTRAAIGMPMDRLLSASSISEAEFIKALRVEFSVFNDNRESNFAVYEYENTGAELNFTYRFNK